MALTDKNGVSARQIGSCDAAYRAMMHAGLDGVAAYLAGNPLGRLLAVKGAPGAAELAGGAVLSGVDGVALGKAMLRLGFAPDDLCACLVAPYGRPPLTAGELLHVVMTVDPSVVLALDKGAAEVLVRALGIGDMPVPGTRVHAKGYPLVMVDGFESLLASQEGKRVAWNQLKQAYRPKAPY